MSALIGLGSVLVLFVSFLLLVKYEGYKGARFFEEKRVRFDRFIGRVGFILTHVDFSSFTWQLLKDSLMHVAHIALQFLLLGIRFIERLLTRTVRGIRVQKAETAHEGTLKTTSDFFKKVGHRTRQLLPKGKKRTEGVVEASGAGEVLPEEEGSVG